ncbi:MAG: hypothetical protein J6W06_04010 [Bacteroidales bacterium]|nr:hypothetical protein [Bacteroidales bacterium]
MLGAIKLENFEGLTAMPQKAASAWAAVNAGIVGASYKPLVFVGTQVVKGVNYWFIAEQTLVTHPPVRRIVTIAINEFEGEYTIVPSSIEVVIS